MKVRLDIELTFQDDAKAKKVATGLKKYLKKNCFNLELSLSKYLGVEIENEDTYYDDYSIVESSKRPKNKFIILAMRSLPNKDLEKFTLEFLKVNPVKIKGQRGQALI